MSGRLRYLLDTNVISETRRRRADRGVLDFFTRTSSASLYLSVLTLGEIRKGVNSLIATDPDGARRLVSWLDGLEYSFADRLISIDGPVARIWGELSAQKPGAAIDRLLAATAIHHDLTMVTRNTADFAGIPLKLLNPWSEEAPPVSRAALVPDYRR
jgi:predicted nucleic acid-binding protein